MWSYYGAKTNLVDLYPKPKHDLIIEPFAGSARYALKYFDRDVLLVDKYPVVIDIWKWLQSCSEKDILSLPKRLPIGSSFNDFAFDCNAQRLFYSFISGCGDHSPRNKPTKRKTIDRPNHVSYNLKRVAASLFKIKHWEIQLGTYEDIKNRNATWFIDPPYQHGGYVYPMSSLKIDFASLREWCMVRTGQVIVCENMKADWIPLVPIGVCNGSLKRSIEGIWTNEETHYHNLQQSLFSQVI